MWAKQHLKPIPDSWAKNIPYTEHSDGTITAYVQAPTHGSKLEKHLAITTELKGYFPYRGIRVGAVMQGPTVAVQFGKQAAELFRNACKRAEVIPRE